MTRVKETLELEINGALVELVNDGIKKLGDMDEGMDAAKEWISGELKEGKIEGWMPYANFESSLSFKVKKSKSMKIEYRTVGHPTGEPTVIDLGEHVVDLKLNDVSLDEIEGGIAVNNPKGSLVIEPVASNLIHIIKKNR